MLRLLPLICLLLAYFSFCSVTAAQDEEVNYSVYLIGDTGSPLVDSPDPVFTNLEKRLAQEGKKSAIIFLGDNIYNNGLPPEDLVEQRAYRKKAEKKLLVQLEAIQDFKGEIYFIPGNHDWNDAHVDGIDYIKAQEEFVEFFLDRGDVLIPDHGCPGPETKKLGKNILLVAMDSQWWLHPHTDEQLESAKCPNKNIDDIIQELKEILDENDDKQIIVALHHPIFSDGTHNGHYTLKDHLFPLSNIKRGLFIPLPGLGSLYPFYRTAFGAKQDIPHPLYQELRNQILSSIQTQRNVIFASGHEHNLQYFYQRNNHFIKSGSGSKSSGLPKITDAQFSSTSLGYAKLEYFKSGCVRLKYYAIEDGVETEVYSEDIVKPDPEFGRDYDTYEISEDPMGMQASHLYEKGGFHKFIFGDLYRKDWATPVAFRPINLSKELGGLRPSKIGGGMSSKSIRLKANDKKQYVLRSVEKGVAKVVPPPFRNTVIQDVFQDQIAASQPYAALVVPPFADAVGVYHTNPQLVYLPEQPALGDFNESYANRLYLFEERPSGNQEDVQDFGNSRKIISYSDMLEKIQSSSSDHIHQDQVLKSRLLDFFLGDWDRHDDQWRWASFKEMNEEGTEKHTFYEPIPRDRDQVLFRYEGFMPFIIKMLSPELRKFQTFGTDIKNLKYLAFNARHFDRSYINELDKAEWTQIATDFQNSISDEVIEDALSRLPEPIYNLRAEEYRKAFKSRRTQIKDWADEHYQYLAKYVDVVGTKKNEFFQGIRNPDGTLDVRVYQMKKKGNLDDIIYSRTFYPDETKEVRMYGLSGEDVFEISGTSKKGPKIRIIGGKGNDEIENTSILKGGHKSVFSYDKLSDNGMGPGTDGRDLRSDDYHVNQYDRKEYYYNASIGIPFLAFTPDDGLILQYSHALSTYGFRKQPYSTKHNFGLRYALGSTQLSFDYSGHFIDVMGKTDLRLDAYIHLPDNVSNFFGLSNIQSFNVSDFEDFNFFRYDQSDLLIRPSLSWSNKNNTSHFQIGPYYRSVQVDDDPDDFVAQLELSGLDATAFEKSDYLGINAQYEFTRVDNIGYPTTGMSFVFNPSYNHNLNNSDDRFTRLHASLTLYNYLWVPKPFVLASKIEAGTIAGDFNFYQAQYIGQQNGLRAFRNNRFGGESSLLFTNDLRVKLFTGKNGALPASFGLIGAYDFGRVWNENEAPSRWHQSYGGGFFISPFDVLPISFYYMKSNENTTNFLIRLGFAI